MFEHYGFETGTVILPGLDLTVTLKPNQYFRNDGAVNDIKEHTIEIFEELNIDFKEFPKELEMDPIHGYRITITNGGETAAIIYVRKGSEASERYTFGHESTHVVRTFDLENDFLAILRQNGFYLDPFKQYADEESMADIGGLFSLYVAEKHKNCLDPPYTQLLDDLMKSKTWCNP